MDEIIKEMIWEYGDPILIDVKISGNIYVIIDGQTNRPGDKIIVRNPKNKRSGDKRNHQSWCLS